MTDFQTLFPHVSLSIIHFQKFEVISHISKVVVDFLLGSVFVKLIQRGKELIKDRMAYSTLVL